MAFKNKDLLVNVLPQGAVNAADLAKICLFRTNICRFPTFCLHRTCLYFGSCLCGRCSYLPTITQTCRLCSNAPSCGFVSDFGGGGGGGGCNFQNSCGPGGSACDPTIFCAGASEPFVIEDLEDLVTLRGELRETLARLDQIEKEGLASGIQTRADADALEKQLTEQLEHVRRRREGLK